MICRTTLGPSPRDTIVVVRLVEAQYEDGALRPVQRLSLRSGERVNLIIVRRPDPGRWDLARLAKTGNEDDLALAEQGLAKWAIALEEEERSRSEERFGGLTSVILSARPPAFVARWW